MPPAFPSFGLIVGGVPFAPLVEQFAAHGRSSGGGPDGHSDAVPGFPVGGSGVGDGGDGGGDAERVGLWLAGVVVVAVGIAGRLRADDDGDLGHEGGEVGFGDDGQIGERDLAGRGGGPYEVGAAVVASEGHELLSGAQGFDLAAVIPGVAFAGDDQFARLTLGGAVEQQAAGGIGPGADGCRAEPLDGQRADAGGEHGVVYVDIEGAEAVAEDAGVEREGDGGDGDAERRVFEGGLAPVLAQRAFAGGGAFGVPVVDWHGPETGVPEPGSLRAYVVEHAHNPATPRSSRGIFLPARRSRCR